ncbi:hypothetical protein ACQ4PT_021995 [Festuca glaucescens]
MGTRVRGAWGVFEDARPAAAMVVAEFIFSALQIFNKLALDDGMDVRVLVAYRPMFGAAFLCPVAFFIERITINQNLLVLAMKLTNSTTIVTALCNLTPQSTFIVAILSRMETLKLKKPSGRAKLTGTLVGLSGAMLLTFYKGPEIKFIHHLGRTGFSRAHGDHQLLRPPLAEVSRILGSFLAIASCFSFAIWLTIQAKVGQVYPCHYSIAAMVCLFGAVQSTLLALCTHRDMDYWRLGLNIRLYSSAYAGIVVSGSAFPLMSWCLRKKGPLYVAMFGPLVVVFVAVMSSIVLDETLHIGIVLGAVLIVAGLYMVLWGKAREEDEEEDAPKLVSQDEELGKESVPPAGNVET